MEIWFWLAIGSAISGGIGAFTHKVAANNNYDISVLNVFASAISALILLCLTWYFAGFSYLIHLSTVLAFGGAFAYMITLILKVESLKEIDSAIFFPLYKVAGPLFAVLFGIILFSESFTKAEWLGLVFSISVPLLLITKAEDARQSNLKRGVYTLLIAAVFSSISVALYKYGTDITKNVWLYLFIGDLFLGLSSLLFLLRKHKTETLRHIRTEINPKSLRLISVMSLAQAVGVATLIFAFNTGGTLGIVYTINSLYILTPIILSIIIYKEHWNLRKAVAIVLSVIALALFK